MCFSVMRNKVDTHRYKNMEAFEADFKLIIHNCCMYNAKDTVFYKEAVLLKEEVRYFKYNQLSDVNLSFLKLTYGVKIIFDDLKSKKLKQVFLKSLYLFPKFSQTVWLYQKYLFSKVIQIWEFLPWFVR